LSAETAETAEAAELFNVWIFIAVGFGIIALMHTAPTRFLLEAMAGETAVWHMPRSSPPTVYLTFDDGPNPTTTPDLLDVLGREGVRATFFLIDEHITDQTAPIVRRMFADGHAVALHTGNRWYLLKSPSELADTLSRAAKRIEEIAGERPCRAFRPHGGWRSGQMYEGLKRIDYKLVGWGWMLWDWNWGRERTADAIVPRLVALARAGDIIVMHDGDERAPFADQRYTVEATAKLIPALRERGFRFGTVCQTRPADASAGTGDRGR
jgi:peptidoglycan/xylan/chitin deacetylase (PgdA/CDA1 family)